MIDATRATRSTITMSEYIVRALRAWGISHVFTLPGGLIDPQLAMQLQTMARDGHKIQAIRLLRQATHTDLATAKKYIDRL